MEAFVRIKRVSDPINDRVRAGLIGQLSSSCRGSDADDFPCLSQLVHSFLEEDGDGELGRPGCGTDSDWAGSASDAKDTIETVLDGWFESDRSDSYRNLLQDHVLKTTELFPAQQLSGAVLRRRVVLFLQKIGHNAAICKTRWGSSGGLTAGDYEFVDVVRAGPGEQSRYLIDLDFASQFEIARPTSQYLSLLQALPKVFVGQADDLKAMVKAASGAAKRSLKSRGLSVPPWRKCHYMRNKWLGPYHRTSNLAAATGPVNANGSATCCWVGFDEVVDGRLIVRTR